MTEQVTRENWSSRLGFILAAAGSSIGLGNIWKFPYLAGENGGGAFVILYLICIIVLGLPIMIAEITIGRHTGKNPVGAFRIIGGGKWTGVGYLGVLTGFFILSYYSVVGGWTLGYIAKGLSGAVSAITDVAAAESAFNEFIQSPPAMVGCHLLFMALTVSIVIGGVIKGIERWNKILLPILFVILLVLIIKANTMEGSYQGLVFYLKPDFSKINVKVVIEALGQCFFSLSLGMGAMITYGSYLSRNERVLKSSLQIGLLDTMAAFLSGLAVFPAVFAVGMMPDKGPGLTFNILPVVFSKMAFGSIFATLFFILLFIAAMTSAVSLLEVTVAYMTDERGWLRRNAVFFCGFMIFILGIPSALSFNVMSGTKVFMGNTFFDFMDKLTSIYMLPIGGFLIAVCLGWKYGLRKTMHELDTDTRARWFQEVWAVTIKFISPVILFLIIVYFGVYRLIR